MNSWTESVAIRMIDAATDPVAVITLALVLVFVLSGLAGRALLYVESHVRELGTRI